MKDRLIVLGKKLGMTQVFDDNSRLLPVTVVELGPCFVSQVKSAEKDGYSAVQIAYSDAKESNLSKPEKGHLKKAKLKTFSKLKEFTAEDTDAFKLGEELGVNNFQEGEKVDVVSKTKGKGFQGVVKRYGFAGGCASHGSMFHRRGGSYGMCQWPGRVYKNRKMPGHMGDVRCTVQNLKIVKILKDKNLLLVKGSIPGGKGSLIQVRKAKKSK